MTTKYECYKKLNSKPVFVAQFQDEGKAKEFQERNNNIEIKLGLSKTIDIRDEYWCGEKND